MRRMLLVTASMYLAMALIIFWELFSGGLGNQADIASYICSWITYIVIQCNLFFIVAGLEFNVTLQVVVA